jgi:DNA-binding SARP family transcriptional activator
VEGLEFRVLGPFEVAREGEVLDLGPPRQRAVLALLLRHAGALVPTDRLIDEIWGEDPPQRARNNVAVYVANLRKLVELGAPGTPQILVSKRGGYTLQLADRNLDAAHFEDLVADGRALIADGQVEEGVASLRTALSLWRGDALADLANEEFAVRWAAQLDEARLAATEDRIDAELQLGHHAALVGELEALVRAHPLRERMWGQLMLALYRSGRQGDALRAYARLRAILRDEIGLDPSAELRALETSIIQQSPTLDLSVVAPPPAAPVEASRPSVPPVRLPRRQRRNVAVGVVGIVAVILVATAVGVAVTRSHPPAIPAVAYTPRYAARSCPVDFHSAVPDGRCGDLAVPVDRSHPDRQWMHLLVRRSPARSAKPARDPVISIDTKGLLESSATSPARDHADLYEIADRLSWAPDQRLSCPEAKPEFDRLLSDDEHDLALIAKTQDDYRRCRARLVEQRIDLTHYTPADAAGDVVDLVRALRLEHINLVAGLDDSLTAYAVERQAPRAVRTLTLQNPIAAGSSGTSDPTAELARVFDASSGSATETPPARPRIRTSTVSTSRIGHK